ncbi:MAG: hypothetical protein EOP45_17430, partial [Sphingobacteriaceae bacterium]
TDGSVKVQIHGFSDSSTAALGAQLYVRVIRQNGKITCNLLVSKTRVAPLKTVTIPRLELSAAEMLARLLVETKKAMEWNNVEYTLWTDSSISLHWIRKQPNELKTYVANRVASIQNRTEIDCWRHIDTKSNPADLLSRGISAADLVDNRLWLHGPEWMMLTESQWPNSKFMVEQSDETLKEQKVFSITQFRPAITIRLKDSVKAVDLLQYARTLEKAVNILSFVIRCNNVYRLRKDRRAQRKKRGQINVQITPPTEIEKMQAMEYFIQKEQQAHYNGALTALKKGESVPVKCSLDRLHPCLDQNGIMRVGGRIDRAEIDYEMKHPVIIPNGSRLAELLLSYAHRITKHGGVQVTAHFLRQKYWIPKLRSSMRACIHRCVVCVRLNARLEHQLMSELPADRVQPGKAFLSTGVDYAGPFNCKIMDRDGQTIIIHKVWIAVFVCMRTRAVHLDVIT